MVVGRYQVFLANLNPAIGREIKKARPCLVVSPNEMNAYIATVIIAPMTTVLDQLRTVGKRRLVKRVGRIDARTVARVKAVLSEMLVE